MANYAASVLAEAQVILNERYAAPEKRVKSAGVLGAFMDNTELALPRVAEMRTKEERPVKGHMFNRSKRSTTNSRTHNHTGTTGDSTEVNFNWKTYADKCATSLKRSDNNVFADAQIVANEIDNCLKNIYESMNADALAHLDANKTGVNVASRNGTFNGTNEIFEVETSKEARFVQMVKSMLRQNYHNGLSTMVYDPVLFSIVEHYLMQGQSNSQNTAYQNNLINSLYEAQGLSDGNYVDGLGFVIPEGTIGMLDWIPRQNREGYGDYESVLGGYGTITDPRTGLLLAVHGYAQRADTSATGGDSQDVVTEWEFSTDISFNNSPLSVTDETTIFGVALKDQA